MMITRSYRASTEDIFTKVSPLHRLRAAGLM